MKISKQYIRKYFNSLANKINHKPNSDSYLKYKSNFSRSLKKYPENRLSRGVGVDEK